MDEISLYNKMYFWLFYALSAAIMLLSIISYNIYLIVLSSSTLLIAAIALHSGHLINNFAIKKANIIEIKNGYKLSQNLVSASRRLGKSYDSVAVAILRPRIGFNYNGEKMRELLESAKEPFEFSISINEIDKKRILDSLETKRRVKEISISRLKPNSYDKINNLRRQIEIIDNEIANMGSGGKSFEVSIKIKTFSSSDSEYDSELTAAKNIETLANKFSAAIGVDYEIVKGESMLNFI